MSNNITRAYIQAHTILENPESPATSPAELMLPITLTEAVFDRATGQWLSTILNAFTMQDLAYFGEAHFGTAHFGAI